MGVSEEMQRQEIDEPSQLKKIFGSL